MKTALLFALCGCVLLVDGPAPAQEPAIDCKNPQTQRDMTSCAGRDFEAADKALNEQYQASRRIMKKWDSEVSEYSRGAEDALIKAQRAWIAYRDAQCASFGFQVHGGTLEPQLIYQCRADLTRKRTTELKQLTEMMNN
jgi:uncharacterized protein YecT (DUF1311 family)